MRILIVEDEVIMLIVIFFISRFFANRAIKPVKEAFDKQKQFIGDASHELKAPLTAINTNVDVLLSNSQDTIDTYSKWLYYIKSEVDRMTKLTNDLLSVTNTGEGITEEHLEKIIDRFYRTDKSRARKSGGYGLGLAIAKAIVEQHKGRISAKSVMNESTTFNVELPRIVNQ